MSFFKTYFPFLLSQYICAIPQFTQSFYQPYLHLQQLPCLQKKLPERDKMAVFTSFLPVSCEPIPVPKPPLLQLPMTST